MTEHDASEPVQEVAHEDAPAAQDWHLLLYVAGDTPQTARAVRNLERLRAERLPPATVEVIDLVQHPERAAEAQILAVPTLVRQRPGPMRKILGDLSRPEDVLAGLGLGEDA